MQTGKRRYRNSVNGPVAVCDLGTFSGLILLATMRRGSIEAICEEAHTVDLYRGKRAPARIGGDAVARSRAVLGRLGLLASQYGCSHGVVVCTEAIRAAENRQRVVRELQESTPFPIRIISQKREAALAALGAQSGLPASNRPTCVIDIGGGSTEIMFLRGGGWAFRGVRIGAARATGEWHKAGRPDPDRFQALATASFRRIRIPPTLRDHRTIGVGGTIATLAAISLDMRKVSPRALHGTCLSTSQISDLAARLAGLSETQIARLIPFDPNRARVLTAGTFLWAAVLNRVGARDVTVSMRGLRWGAAARLLDGMRV